MTAPAAVEPAPPVDPLDRYDAYARLGDTPMPHPPVGTLAPALQARLDELEALAGARARHHVQPLQRAIPQQLAAAIAPAVARLGPILEQQRQVEASNDFSPGAAGARWLLARQADGVRAELRRALAPAVTAAEAALDAEDRRQAAIHAADGDVPALDGPGRAALGDLLDVLPHLDGAERVARLEALVAQTLREAATPAARAFLRHVAPVVRTLARGADPATDHGVKLGALLFAVERAGRNPDAEAARRARTYLELGRVELPQLARALMDRHAASAVDRELAAMTVRGLQLFVVD